MKTIRLRMALLTLVTAGAMSLSAQTLLLSVEGEDFVASAFNGGSGTGSNAEPRVESNLEGASGGMYVRGLSQSNYVLYNYYVATEGVYKLVIRYNCTKEETAVQAPFITTRINNQVKVGPVAVPFTPNDVDEKPSFGNFEQLVYCEAGWNRLLIGAGGNGKYNARIDKWDLYASGVSYEKPAIDPAAPFATYDAAYDNGVDVYKYGLEDLAKSITFDGDDTNSTLGYLFDNDFATEYVSSRDREMIFLEFEQPIVLRQLVLGSLLRRGKMMVEYSADGETWEEWVRNESFTQQRNNTGGNGGTGTVNWWMNPYAPFVDNTTTGKFIRISLFKAPGAQEIVLSEIALYGNVLTGDLVVGTNTYKSMGDDLTKEENGEWKSLTNGDGVVIQEETYGPYLKGSFGALDNAFGSKFSVPSKNFILTYEFRSSAVVTSYWVSSATSGSRFIKNWTLQASNDNDTYVDLHTVNNMKQFHNNMLLPFSVVNATTYKYYRLNVAANNGDGGFSELGDWMLFGQMSSTANGGISEAQVKVYTSDRRIHIVANEGIFYSVINGYGQLVQSGAIESSQCSLSVVPGVYIVTVGGHSVKTVVLGQ